MRIAISNIAWEVADDQHVADILKQHHVDAVDVAPGKYFPDPKSADTLDIARVRKWWADRGIEITGMQSLLFGTSGLNLFGTAESQEAMLDHLRAVCRIGGELGARRLVFGSPRNRDRTGPDRRSRARYRGGLLPPVGRHCGLAWRARVPGTQSATLWR
ncbi:sugar phosphate isomerase/epimerase family protein [Paraburkholderia caledonica]|uniref:sugar phosphate isomerase/epimerase family protein n=1 Tax=Paraburkholderia caledonica TaxID=134536 RepID=UPI001FC96511|nr:hypothetical protein [Paraburkholderia caledonica]